jgi:hypothetical protein
MSDLLLTVNGESFHPKRPRLGDRWNDWEDDDDDQPMRLDDRSARQLARILYLAGNLDGSGIPRRTVAGAPLDQIRAELTRRAHGPVPPPIDLWPEGVRILIRVGSCPGIEQWRGDDCPPIRDLPTDWLRAELAIRREGWVLDPDDEWEIRVIEDALFEREFGSRGASW